MSELSPILAGAAVPACLPAKPDWRATPTTDEQRVAVLALHRVLESHSRLVREAYLQALPDPVLSAFFSEMTAHLSCEVCGKPFREGERLHASCTSADEELSDAAYLFVTHIKCGARLNGAAADNIRQKISARARREFKRAYLSVTGVGGAA